MYSGPTVRVQLTRSMGGVKPKMKAVIKGLGFKRTLQVVERPDTPEIRGMIRKVTPWVTVLEGGK